MQTPMRSERRNAGGFTLVEALVALVIVSLGMMAVNTQLNQYVVASVYVRDKVLASWVASNEATELSVRGVWPEIGTESDEIEFAGRNWFYKIEISETEVENLRRADISVSFADDPDRVIDRLSAFIEPPAPNGFVPVRWTSGPGDIG